MVSHVFSLRAEFSRFPNLLAASRDSGEQQAYGTKLHVSMWNAPKPQEGTTRTHGSSNLQQPYSSALLLQCHRYEIGT